MTDENDKSKRSTGETARRIWLAGIGAYGRAFTETKEAIKDVSGEASDVFDDLVQKGQVFEAVIGMKSKEMLDKTGVNDLKMPEMKMPEMGDFKMDARIKKMRERLKSSVGFDEAAPAGKGSDIDARLDRIEAKLDAVLAALKPTPTRRKAPVKKTATQRSAAKKPAAKKTAAKKPAAKNTTAKKS